MKREYHRQRFEPPAGWGAQAFMIFWGLGFGSAVLMAPLAVGLLFGIVGWGVAAGAAWKLLSDVGRQRRGIVLDAKGLLDTHWIIADRRVPWDQIVGVDLTAEIATVRVAGGPPIVFDPRVNGWRRLAQRIQQVIQPAAPAAVPAGSLVDEAELAEWLGIPRDGSLTCRGSGSLALPLLLVPVWLAITGGLVALYWPFFKGMSELDGAMRLGALMFTLAHATIFFGVFSGGLLAGIIRLSRQALDRGLTVDVEGLTAGGPGGRERYDWSEFHGLRMVHGEWQLNLGDDIHRILPTDQQANRLITALQNVLAQRARGRVFPSLAELPAGAISRSRLTAPAGAEARGLSQVDADG